MNRGTLALGGGLLVLAVLLLFTTRKSMTGDTNETAYSNRNGSHAPPLLTNERVNSVPAKSQRRKDGVLSKHSKAWMLAREVEKLTPDLGAVVITKADYGVKNEGEPPAQGRVENWKFLGYTNDSGLDTLVIINTREGIRKFFASIHAESGNESFSTDSSEVVVNLLLSENKQYSQRAKRDTASPRSLPFVFELSVKKIGGNGPDDKPQNRVGGSD